MIRAKIDTFRQIRDHNIPFKDKVTLIFCVFSSSDVGSKWHLLYSLLHPKTKRLNRLLGDLLSSSAPESKQWRSNCLQLTQGGSKIRRSCQSTIVGAACTELRHSDRNLRTENKSLWNRDSKKKKPGWIFIITGWVYTHFQLTFMFKQLEKLILHPMTLLDIFHMFCSVDTSRFVGLEHLVRPADLQEQVKHVWRLDPAEQQTHGHVFLPFVWTFKIFVKLIIFDQSTAVQLHHSIKIHQLITKRTITPCTQTSTMKQSVIN